jgi:integrase
MAAYADAERSIADRLKGTLTGLVTDYTASLEFEQLATSTRAEYLRCLGKAEREFGDMPLSVLDDPGVRADLMDYHAKVAKQSGEREADNRLTIISAMLGWAVQKSRLRANNVAGFRRLYHSDRSAFIWTPELIDRFMAVAPLEMQQAMILALHTGQRQGDLLRLAWTNYDGATISLRQGKSRRHAVAGPLIAIPCTLALRRMLDAMPRLAATILTTRTGAPFRKRYFSKLWAEATAAAGIEDLHFHDIRGTSVTLLSEAGANPQQIAAITGHTLKNVSQILDRYLARTRGLAEQAIFHFENSPRTDFANRLQTRPQGPEGRKENGNG